ncbi:aromatic compound dioxygenase [Penicillium tannophilum]|nr:aromatic compound dioxygenase [Penicillium tannophilum]
MDLDTCAPLEGVMLSFDIKVSKIPGREVQYYVYQTLLLVSMWLTDEQGMMQMKTVFPGALISTDAVQNERRIPS